MHSSRMRTGRWLTVCRSLLPGGVYFQGVCLLPRGVCSWRVCLPQGGVCFQRVSASGGCLLLGGLLWMGCLPPGSVCPQRCLLRGCLLPGVCVLWGVVSQHALTQTPPPVNRMTNSSKNITLATTSLRPVIMSLPLGNPIYFYVKVTAAPTKIKEKRMHSSRMRTGRALTISGGGVGAFWEKKI